MGSMKRFLTRGRSTQLSAEMERWVRSTDRLCWKNMPPACYDVMVRLTQPDRPPDRWDILVLLAMVCTAARVLGVPEQRVGMGAEDMAEFVECMAVDRGLWALLERGDVTRTMRREYPHPDGLRSLLTWYARHLLDPRIDWKREHLDEMDAFEYTFPEQAAAQEDACRTPSPA